MWIRRGFLGVATMGDGADTIGYGTDTVNRADAKPLVESDCPCPVRRSEGRRGAMAQQIGGGLMVETLDAKNW